VIDSIVFATGQPIFPAGWGGAETAVHDLLLGLCARGVAVRALGATPRGEASRVRRRIETYFDASLSGDRYRYDVGYASEIVSPESFVERLDAYLTEQRPDLVLTQAIAWPDVTAAAARHGVRSILWVHGPDVTKIPVPERGADRVLYNSAFTRDFLADRFPLDGDVFHPPVDLARYRVDGPGPGGALTLINPLPVKGGHLLVPLARAVPDRQFLAVEGWTLPPFVARLLAREPNVSVIPWQHDMRSVYERTAVLLVPSVFEPFGRAPLEAACSGIPSIASGTGGLCEALGSEGLFVPVDAPIEDWVQAIRRLEDTTVYAREATRHAAWAERFAVASQVERFVSLLSGSGQEHRP
jgi:glycosyltransferase involved in cell wall biosynthesis